jgi:hypothetical protein
MSRDNIIVLVLMCWSCACVAAEKPTIFNLTTGQRTQIDGLVHEHFGQLYEVVDVNPSGRAFKNARGVSGFGPTKLVYVDGNCVRGEVLLLYVITFEGSVASTYAAKSSDPVLSNVAVQSMGQRRFQPAELDGKIVPILAATRFVFDCPH